MATTQELIDDAEAALHKLQTGTAAVSVSKGDRRVEFNQADTGKLEKYISALKAKLAGKPVVRNRVRYGVPD